MNKIQRAKSYLRSILSLVLLVTFISCSSNKTFKKNEKSEEKNSFFTNQVVKSKIADLWEFCIELNSY
jgi:hypothetical protein